MFFVLNSLFGLPEVGDGRIGCKKEVLMKNKLAQITKTGAILRRSKISHSLAAYGDHRLLW